MKRAALGLILLLAAVSAGADPGRPVPTITVSGEGEARAAPDAAELELGVLRQAASAREALEENAKAVKQLLTTVERLGVPASSVQSVEVGLQPEYQHDPTGKNPPRLSGYQATHRLSIRIQDLALVGKLLDEAVRGGANLVQGLRFTVRDPSRLLDQARDRSVEDARRRAERYAEAAGVRLGRLLELQEVGTPAPVPFRARLAVAEAAVPVAPGEETVRAGITATWELLPGH